MWISRLFVLLLYREIIEICLLFQCAAELKKGENLKNHPLQLKILQKIYFSPYHFHNI